MLLSYLVVMERQGCRRKRTTLTRKISRELSHVAARIKNIQQKVYLSNYSLLDFRITNPWKIPIYVIIMKSTFGSKRKARKIQVDEDEDESVITENTTRMYKHPTSRNNADLTKLADRSRLDKTENPKVVARKPFKKSNLRKSLAFDDEASENVQEGTIADDEQGSKPALSQSTFIASKTKKKGSSRLSFGLGEIISGDAAEALEEEEEILLPKKSAFSRRVIESNAFRKGLPIRSTDDDEERPTYSKDYLNELKNSTPNTPKDRQGYVEDAEDEGLDESELEGAMVVDLPEPPSYIPSEAEIREKKERRARLAKEQDFISFSETEDAHRQQLSLLPTRKKAETRLVREDEDLAEGFDEFVDDGKISLGKKAEREAKRKLKKHMAAMIQEAEGGSSDNESDDSEAERRAAYEAAQTRAGMDGLATNKPNPNLSSSYLTSQIPPKISPLPILSECLKRLQATLNGMEQALGQNKKKMEGIDEEKLKIQRREAEVQRLLKEAGERYSALRADAGDPVGDVDAKDMLGESNSASRLDPMVQSRGLESFGNTPIVNQEVEDAG